VTDTDSSLAPQLATYLDKIGCSVTLNQDILAGEADIVLADGATLARLEMNGHSPAGVEIALPGRGHIDIVPKCMLGAQGSLYLLEAILNGLNRR
jgi:hypothetical protein